MTIRFGDLFREGEDRVHACRNTSTPGNRLENAGDRWMCTGGGRDVIVKILQGLPDLHTSGPPYLHDAAKHIAEYLVGNVNFGPYASAALQLHRCFRFQPGLKWTNELCAGLFEATIGLLHREGRDLLLKHILTWCIGCMLMMLRHEKTVAGGGLEFLRHYNNEAYQMSTHLDAHRLPISIGDERFLLLERACGDAEAICHSLFDMCLRESGGCGNEAASQSIVPLSVFEDGASLKRGATVKTISQGLLQKYYLELRCYEATCNNTAETSMHSELACCFEDAKALGWMKPSTTTWAHARCPEHAWFCHSRGPSRGRSPSRGRRSRGHVASPPPARSIPTTPPPPPPPSRPCPGLPPPPPPGPPPPPATKSTSFSSGGYSSRLVEAVTYSGGTGV